MMGKEHGSPGADQSELLHNNVIGDGRKGGRLLVAHSAARRFENDSAQRPHQGRRQRNAVR